MKKLFGKLVAVALVAAMMCGLVACGSKEDTKKEDNKKLDKIVLGTSADYPPFEFIILDENKKQQYVGIDVSMAQKIADDKGVKLEVANMNFDSLIAALQKGEVDMVIAAMEKDGTREKVVDFSDPYYTDLPPMMLVKADKKDTYKDAKSLAGKTIAAQTGTTKADIVGDSFKDSKLLALTSVNDIVNSLAYDKCDAAILDGAVAQQYAQENDDMVIAEIELGKAAPYRVAVQKGDPKGILKDINKSIKNAVDNKLVDQWIEDANAKADKAVE